MAALTPVVLTASINNQAEIEAWFDSITVAVSVAQDALKELAREMSGAPHIAITLTQHLPSDEPIVGDA